MIKQTTMRLTEEARARIRELAQRWSPANPLSATKVIDECVKRVHQSETAARKPRKDERP